MTSRSALWFVLALLLFGGWGESHAQEGGVMLGLHYETPIAKALPYYAGGADSLSRAAYATVLITENAGAFAAWSASDALLIPRRDGFWRVGTKRSVYNNWVEDFVWASPQGAMQALAGIQPYNGEYCQGHRKQTILYAGPEHLSLDQRSAGYCEGAAHPWFFNTLAVVPLDSTAHPGLDITDLLGTAAYETLAANTKTFLDGLGNAERRAAYIEEPDAANWGLRHQDGQWIAIGRLEAAEEISQSTHADLPLAIELPASLTGPVQRMIDPRRVRAFAPDAVDFFVAPDANWLVVLRPNRLTIHLLAPETIGPAALTVPVVPGARPVLVQWATGPRLRGWTRHFERLAPDGGS